MTVAQDVPENLVVRQASRLAARGKVNILQDACATSSTGAGSGKCKADFLQKTRAAAAEATFSCEDDGDSEEGPPAERVP